MFSNPEKNIEQLGLTPGMKVADLGSGSGFYTIASARLVGTSGRVYSIDIQKDLLTRIKTEASKQKLLNVEIIWGDIEKIRGTRLSDSSIDAVIASNICFQVQEKDIFIKEIYRILKKNGQVLVIDWSDSFSNLGPIASDIFTKEMAKKLFEEAGFKADKDFYAGDHHYGLIFKKQ